MELVATLETLLLLLLALLLLDGTKSMFVGMRMLVDEDLANACEGSDDDSILETHMHIYKSVSSYIISGTEIKIKNCLCFNKSKLCMLLCCALFVDNHSVCHD